MTAQEALAKFTRWYVEPIKLLKTLPNGDGGFVAFMADLALFERLIVAILKSQNRLSNDEYEHHNEKKQKSQSELDDDNLIRQEMAKNLGLSEGQQRVFWKMFRVGLLHQGMPKTGRTGFDLHDSYSAYPEFKTYNGTEIICINPWKFTERVLKEFLDNPQLITTSESFPLASILPTIDTHPKAEDSAQHGGIEGLANDYVYNAATQTTVPAKFDSPFPDGPVFRTEEKSDDWYPNVGGTLSPQLHDQFVRQRESIQIPSPTPQQLDYMVRLYPPQVSSSQQVTIDQLPESDYNSQQESSRVDGKPKKMVSDRKKARTSGGTQKRKKG